ncbi:hypothetical protein LQW54_010666 [Pestalotiopsis sp. IQ-011]
MAVARTLTEAGLQQLERELSPSITPPPSERQNTPAEVELRNVSNLVFLLSRYTRGRECLKRHKIAKSSPPFGILYRGAEPNLEELQTLKVILQSKYDQLKPKEQPDGRLKRLQQEVLNILLRLFQLGNQGHWVLGEEEDIQIRDYTYDPILEYHGSDAANPDWWEGKLARLVERFQQAKNNVLPSTTAPAATIDVLREQLAQQRKSFQRPRVESVGYWVQSLAPPPKRSLTMDESEDASIAESGTATKRRKLVGNEERVDEFTTCFEPSSNNIQERGITESKCYTEKNEG